MTHHHLGFHLFHRFKSNAYHNDDGSTAHGEASQTSYVTVNDGHDGDECQEQRTNEGNSGEDLADKFSGGLAGTDARDGAVVLPQVVGHLNGVILDGHIEIREHQNQNEVQYGIQPAGGGEGVKEALPEPAFHIASHKQLNGAGNGENGAGEDDRHHAAHAYLNRHMGGLSAVHFPAHHALGVLDRDPALGVVHEDNDPDHGQEQDDPQRYQEIILAQAGVCVGHRDIGPKLLARVGEPGYDARKQQDRNTIADALLVDLLAQPHHQGSACRKCKDNNDCSEYLAEALVKQGNVVVTQVEIIGGTLDQAQNHRDITGDGADLFPAFLPFASQALQRRDCHCQKLHDNGGVDVGGNAHSKQGSLCKGATGHHVGIAQSTACAIHIIHQLLQSVYVQERHGNNRAEPEHDNDKQGKEDLLPKIRDFPSVPNSIEQLRSPPLFRLQLRFSLLQQRRKRSPSRSGFYSAYHWTGS